MEKEILILTKSAKHGAYCVVGYDVHENRLIRLTSSDKESKNSLLEKHLVYTNGEIVDCLDVVKVELIQAVPKEIHKEDWLINENKNFQKIRKGSLNELKEIIYYNQGYIFGNTEEYLNYNDTKKQEVSIIVALVDNVKIYKYFQKTKVNFIYNNQQYLRISVTDPNYFEYNDDIYYKKALIIFSLPDSSDIWCINNNKFYKYAAKILPIPNK